MLTANSQTRTAIDSSRAKLVGDVLYPNINEERFAALFSDKASRPNIEIRKYICFLVLERMYNQPESVALEFLRCGALNYQYALHTTQDEKQPLSENSLRRFRRAVENYNREHGCDLIKEEFERISKQIGVSMGVLPDPVEDSDDSIQKILIRMDSMEIEAHAKVMTRLEILYTSVVIVLRYFLKMDQDYLIPEALMHYFKKEDHNNTLYYRASGDAKTEIQHSRIEAAIQDMVLLHDIITLNFRSQFISSVPELSVFERVYGEQVILDDNGVRIPRDKHDISADSVQNPFDETVTYRNKRGPHHGSVLNVAEAHDGKGNGVIIAADVAPNTVSDNELEETFIDGLPENGPAIELQTDGAYGSETLRKKEQEKGVDRKSTSLTGKMPDLIFADFRLNEDERKVLSCPCGKIPEDCSYNENKGIITATIPNNGCSSCPNRNKCKAKVNNKKSKSTVCVKVSTINRAKHVKKLKTKEYKQAACQRNAVEGIMSVLRRKYGIDHIPVFGLEQSKTWIWCSLLSYNLAKLQRYERVRPKIVFTC